MDQRQNLKTVVRGAYDVQKLRIQMGNRIVGNFKAKLGQVAGEKEESIDPEGKEILQMLRVCHKKLTDGVVTVRKIKFEHDEIISSFTELCLVSQYLDLAKYETQHFKSLGIILNEFPIFTEFLLDVKGVGPAMAGVIISEIDISKARYPSSLWKYAGLDVAGDGRGRSRRKEHLVDAEYEDRDGKTQTRKSITFNPFLKTKMVGVLGSSFIKLRDSPYRKMYDDYKHRMESHAVYGLHNDKVKDADGHQVTSKGRRHNMATRYMVKRFLCDLYVAWRGIEGLPVAPEYSEAKLGMQHRKTG